MLSLLLFISCDRSVGEPPSVAPADARRIAVGTALPIAVPSCALLTACPQDDLDPAACLDDPALFTVSTLGDAVTSIELDEHAVVPPGAWFAPFPDPDGGCDLTLFSFRSRG
jgi:hypothetical protein